eukprot:3936072-Pleurochrysis_carterae.AAC.1
MVNACWQSKLKLKHRSQIAIQKKTVNHNNATILNSIAALRFDAVVPAERCWSSPYNSLILKYCAYSFTLDDGRWSNAKWL